MAAVMTMTDQEIRWYREARRRGWAAEAAVEYMRARTVVRDSDLRWYAEPDTDDDGGLVILLTDDDGEVVDALGAVDVAFTVSDHGNVHYDEDDPYLIWLVADMIREAESVTA